MSSTQPPRRKKSRRSSRQLGSWRHFILATAGLLALIVIAFLANLWRNVDNTLGVIEQEDPRLRQTAPQASVQPNPTRSIPTLAASIATRQPIRIATPVPSIVVNNSLHTKLRQPFTVLLIGVDKRPDPIEGARSDTLILVRLDPSTNNASMLSIPRDSVVLIPNVGYAKINAAYSQGYSAPAAFYGAGTSPDAAGAALAAQTVEQWLGITVDYTAQVDFHGFENLVDILGGVLLDVPNPLYDGEYPTEDYGYQRIFIPAGLQVIDGRTALIYARTRHASSDFQRSQRQQQVLRALLTQLRERGLFENAALLPQWAELLRETVRTSMPLSDFSFVQGLASIARNLDTKNIQQFSINPDEVALDGEDGSDLYWNAASLAELVARWENP